MICLHLKKQDTFLDWVIRIHENGTLGYKDQCNVVWNPVFICENQPPSDAADG